MIDLIEELIEGETVYVLFDDDTYNHILYGEYKIVKTEYKKMNVQTATLTLQNKPKKERYFRESIVLKGYRINFNYTKKEYKVFDDFDEMIKHFCKKISRTENNPKLLKKLQKMYPDNFRFRSTY